MRYIRFLKTPRLIYDQQDPGFLAKAKVKCLVTISSDLGDSFFPHDVTLRVELCPCASNSPPVMCKKVKWTCEDAYGLDIEIPLKNTRFGAADRTLEWPLEVYVGPGKASEPHLFLDLNSGRYCGILGAWSGPLDPENGSNEAAKTVERRVALRVGHSINILEETGESIARHLWDAGVMLTCHVGVQVLNGNFKDRIAGALQPATGKRRLQVLELGTGCGMVGIGIAQVIENADITLTDLPEAQSIATLNLVNSRTRFALNTNAVFRPLNWEEDLPCNLNQGSTCLHCTQFDLIVAADCTYNCDSSPALVNTLCSLTGRSPEAIIMIAMKIRHEDENVFFSLMTKAGFVQIHQQMDYFPNDGGLEDEKEIFEVYLYEYGRSRTADLVQNECGVGESGCGRLQKDDRTISREMRPTSMPDGSRKRKR